MIIETRRTQEDSYEAISFDIIENGITVGYASVMIDDSSAYCERIDIEETFRNRGLGTAALYGHTTLTRRMTTNSTHGISDITTQVK